MFPAFGALGFWGLWGLWGNGLDVLLVDYCVFGLGSLGSFTLDCGSLRRNPEVLSSGKDVFGGASLIDTLPN